MLRTCLVSSLWRSRRLRRVLRGVLAVVLPLILLWAGFDLYWSIELQSKLHALRASGQPLTFAEMMPTDIPDSQNAAAAYREALRLPYSHIPNYPAVDYPRDNDPAHESEARAYLATPEVQAQLAAAERISAMPECVWLPRLEQDQHSFLCGQTRAFVVLAALQATWLARHGQPDEALHWCAVGVRIARQAGRYPDQVGLLVEIADTAIALQPVQEVIEAHRAGPAGRRELDAALAPIDLSQATTTALRGRIARQMDLFADLRAGRKRMRRMMKAEQLYEDWKAGRIDLQSALNAANDEKRDLGGNPIWDLYQSRLGRPWMNRDECAYLDLIGPEQAPATLPSFQGKPAFAAVKVKVPPHLLAPIAHVCLRDESILSRLAARRDEGIANVDLCRICLALQGYRTAQGRYPETLQALRGSDPGLHLTDPFSGKPFIYRREGKGFLLYSLGPDLKDDGGKPLRYGPSEGPRGDIVWRCSR